MKYKPILHKKLFFIFPNIKVSQNQCIIWTKYGGFIKNCLSNRQQFHNFSGTRWCTV